MSRKRPLAYTATLEIMMTPDPALVDASTSGLARYPVTPARAAELAQEAQQLHTAVSAAAATLHLDDAPAAFATLLEQRAP